MAKKQFLDLEGLQELIKHIPQITQGDNISISTPDEDNPNKIVISSDIEYATETDIANLFN